MNLYSQMGTADPRKVAQATHSLLTWIQELGRPADQILTSIILAIKICEAYGIELKDAQEYATRMIYSREGYTESEFRALQTYIDKELKPNGVRR